MQSDVLENISADKTLLLLNKLESDMPYSSPVRDWIRVQTVWAEKITDMKVEILSPGGDWRSGIVVCLNTGALEDNKVLALVYACEGQEDNLENILRETKRVPWKKVQMFRGTLDRFVPQTTKVAEEKTGDMVQRNRLCLLYMPATRAAQLDITPPMPGLTLSPLSKDHLEAVCKLWPHYSPDLVPMVRHILTNNRSLGVFLGDQLVSMVLEAEYGGIGLLQTDPQHVRKGFATLALATLSREMGKEGISPHLFVLQNNEVSMSLVTKVGYQLVTTTSTLFTNGFH